MQSNLYLNAVQMGGEEHGWASWDIWATISLFLALNGQEVPPGDDPLHAKQFGPGQVMAVL